MTAGRPALAATTILVLLLVTACAGADDDTTGASATPTAATAEETGPTAAAATPDTAAPTADAAGTEGTRPVEHTAGTTRVPVDPQRIVALDSLVPAYLAELGIPVVGACTEGDFVPEPLQDYYEGVTPFPSCQNEVPYEQVLALAPDLIVGFADQVLAVDPDAYGRLSEIAPTVLPELNEDRIAELVDIGGIFGERDEAQQIVDTFYAETEDLQLDGTFSLIALFGSDTFDLFQDNFLMVQLLERAGMQQAVDPTGVDGYDPDDNRIRALSFERTDLLAGDHMIPVVATAGELSAAVSEQVGDNALWQQVPAVAEGDVIPLDAANVFGGAGLAGYRIALDRVAAEVDS